MARFAVLIYSILFALVLPGGHALAAPGGNVIKLTGDIKLKPDDLKPKHPDKKPRVHIPILVADMTALLGNHFQKVDGVIQVPVKGKMVALPDYVEQLNRWEKYLNGLGYTLRDGPLALRDRGRPGPIERERDPRASRDNLGVVLTLGKRTQKPSQRVDINKPTKHPFIDAVEDPLKQVGNPGQVLKPGDVLLPQRAGRPQNRFNPALAPGLAFKGKLVPFHIRLPDSVINEAPRLLTNDLPCDPKAIHGCPCLPGGANCPHGVQLGSDGGILIDCGVALNPIDENGQHGASATPAPKSWSTPGAACGIKEDGDPACLYEPNGSMHAKWTGIASCELTSGGGGWFNAGVCQELVFTGDQAGTSMQLENAGQSHFDIQLFGKGFSLLQANAFSRFDGQHSSGAKVTVPLTGEVLGPDGFEAQFETPSIIMPVGGIVNIVITGGGKAKLGYDQVSAPFQAPPTQCADKSIGALGLGLTSRAYADLHLSAAIDAWVASAGVSGVLMLADDTFNQAMNDTLDTGHNAITVQPEFSYDIRHLAGSVYLFVKVNLLLYSKTFEIEIFDFAGIDPPPTVVPIEKKVFSSKL